MNNEPRASQSLAITVAMAAVSLGAVVVSVTTAVTVSQLEHSMTPVDVVEGVQGGLAVTWLGWLVLMIALAVVQGRRPDPDRYSRPFPPLGALLPAAVLGAVIGMADSDGGPVYGALFFGVGLTCWVWTACVVLLTEVHEDEQDDDQ